MGEIHFILLLKQQVLQYILKGGVWTTHMEG